MLSNITTTGLAVTSMTSIPLLSAMLLSVAASEELARRGTPSATGIDFSYARHASTRSQWKVLAVVLGPGCVVHWKLPMGDRSLNSVENVVHALRTIQRGSVQTDCVMLLYDKPAEELFSTEQLRKVVMPFCSTLHWEGGQYIDLQKAVLPSYVVAGRYTHVLVVSDDVRLDDFSLDDALQIMHQARIS